MIVLSVTQNTNCDSVRHIIVLCVILLKAIFYCQAQPQLQVKFSLKAELALFSFDPATHPPPPTPVKVYLAAQFQPILTVVDI